MFVQAVGPDATVEVPEDERVRFIIETLVRYVIADGTDFEQLALDAEFQARVLTHPFTLLLQLMV